MFTSLYFSLFFNNITKVLSHMSSLVFYTITLIIIIIIIIIITKLQLTL